MAMQGNLLDMAVADLVQHNCEDRKTAQLTINHYEEEAELFFKDGSVVHASLGDMQGEEVMYRILGWQEGTFALETGVEPPAISIQRNWSGLLIEGARRLDERSANERGRCTTCGAFLNRQDKCNNPRCPRFMNDVGSWNETDDLTQDLDSTKEKQSVAQIGTPKKKSELLADALTAILSESGDLESCAVVGTDGMVLASIVTGKLDEARFGAQAAAFYGICIRASSQLARGTPYQAVIQSDNGNIVAAAINPNTLFVATTGKDAILGMVFRDAAEAARQLSQVV